ncbi:MAG: monofunctional biosynthetic peptidoglycan transglycosylase [Bacteroidetes bacterium]|nr:monofunctional biosynthetic peptidoglycan transglycosylase [Bacteroidota bacterium]
MWKKIRKLIFKATLYFFLGSVLLVFVFRFIPVPLTLLMVQRGVEQKWNGKPIRFEKDWVPLSEIANSMQLAVVCSEDQNFLWHHGFDFEAIRDAMRYNEKQKSRKRKKVRGASTISQQTAKNAFLYPARSFVRKGLEVYFTGLIELLWSKERIMEVYLNVIEMGDGVYGVEAAAQRFFHKPASRLSASEASLIAAVLPNPIRFRADAPSGYIRSRQAAIQMQMRLWGGKLDYEMPEPDK